MVNGTTNIIANDDWSYDSCNRYSIVYYLFNSLHVKISIKEIAMTESLIGFVVTCVSYHTYQIRIRTQDLEDPWKHLDIHAYVSNDQMNNATLYDTVKLSQRVDGSWKVDEILTDKKSWCGVPGL